jgi:two-component system, sensor histidine kinase
MDHPEGAPARRVLLVEDNPDCRSTLSLLLKVYGYEVRAASDGRSGLREAMEWRPDAVVSDIGLPGLDGWQLAPLLRACLGGGAALVALTGYGSAGDLERSRLAGFDAHLVKPADIKELVAALGPA